MSNPKSKIPVSLYTSDDAHLYGGNLGGQYNDARSLSSYSRKRSVGFSSQNSVLQELTENRRLRHVPAGLKDRKVAYVTRRKSLRLTYDPGRDPGDEYLIQKEDEPTEDEGNVSVNYGGVSDHPDGLQDFPNSSNQDHYHDKSEQNVSTDISKEAVTDFDSDRVDKSNDSEKENVDVELDRAESPLSISEHKSVSLDSFQDTELTITPKPSTPAKQNDLTLNLPESPKPSTSREPESDSLGNTLDSAKESTVSSLPPPNFKSSLFKRVRKVSTPVKTPRFSPRPSHTPVIDVLSLRSEELKSGARDTPNTVSDEGTFIKDSLSRFQRQDSTESIRIHYDKHIKKETYEYDKKSLTKYEHLTADNNANTSFKRQNLPKLNTNTKSLNDTENLTKQIIKYEPTRKDSPIVPPVTRKMQIDVKQYETHLTDLAKKPLQHKVPVKANIDSTKQLAKPGASSNVSISINDSEDIFSDRENRSKLKQALYITEDLKLVKRKVKATEMTMKQNLLKQEASAKKRSVLNNLNMQKKITTIPTLPKRTKVPTKLPKPAKNNPYNLLKIKHQEAVAAASAAAAASESHADNDTHTIITDSTSLPIKSASTRVLSYQPRIAPGSVGTRTSVQTRSRHSIETLLPPPQNLNVKPKIHRSNPFKRTTRRISRHNRNSDRTFWVTPSITTTSSASVEKWVAQTVKENTINRDTLALPKLEKGMRDMTLRRVKKKHKLKIRMQRKKSIAKPNNVINKGMYLPLPTKPKKRARHVYTQVGKVKGYESEIPILYDDEDDDGYIDQRASTANERRMFNDYRRYEGDSDHVRINYINPAHRKVGRTSGALVRLFRNGDCNHKGLPLTINQNFKNFESLLVTLNDKIPTPTGVKYIFKWPEGREVKSVKDFQNRCVYIVSSTKNIRRDINYGESREGYWSNKKPSAGKVRGSEVQLFKKPNQRESPKASPYIVPIVHNLQRDKKDKVILNPQTSQSFEEWLEDINNPVIPVRALYISKAPHTQIRSFSHLFRELRNKSTFIACGDEYLPVELAKKRQAPSSNSSAEDSVADNRGRKKISRQQDMDQIYENGRPESPTSTSMSRYDTGPRYLAPAPVAQHRQLTDEGRRKPRGCVQIEIDGVDREFWPPSYYDTEDDGMRPPQVLKCNWVYGFRGRDARHNLTVIPSTGELVYFVASVVVLYDKVKDAQRHYIKHNEEISCLTLHPNGILIATGQLHGKLAEHSSHIRLWDHETLSTFAVIGVGVFYGGIISIGFNHEVGGTLMCALDGSSKHVLSVWRISLDRQGRGDSNYIIARTSTSTDPVQCACFYPADENSSILITYGVRHIYFWKVFFDATRKREAKILRDRNSGIFEDQVPRSVNCLTFLPTGDVVTGDSSGNLMVWDRDPCDAFTCRYVVHAHSGPVMSIVSLEDGTILSGGGNEIKAWDSNTNFRCVMTRTIPTEVGGVRSIVTHVPGGFDGNLYIGTTRSCILDGNLQDKFSCIIQGHSDGIFGLVPHPFEPTFITAGSDAVVYKWSLVTHRVYWRSQIEAPCTSLAVDHHNELVALGTSEGTFVVLNAFNGMHIASVQVGTETISCLAFSPNGLYLAIGCNDGLISIFNVHDRGHTFVKASMALRGHGNGVAKLDWSRDNNSLQTVSHDNELIFWDLINMKQNKVPMKTRDIEWFTNTCNISYALLGPWTNLERGEQIKVVNRSRNKDLVLVGDTAGRLRLYKYPCSRERADYRNVRVYSSEVTACAFTPDGRGALTCGGNDAALIQWAVEEEFN